MFKPAVWTFLCITLLISFASTATRAANPTIGFLGDSNTDEYRSNDNRAYGTPYAATTLSWAELLVDYRGIDAGKWGRWGEPRRSGYAYNWSRSGVTSQGMIIGEQHTGLAKQIAAGDVEYVIIWIGTNDFNFWNGTYDEVYSGALNDKQLAAKIDTIVESITTAVDTLQEAGDPKIVLANFADPGQSYTVISEFPSAEGRERVSETIIAINTQLDALVESRGLVLADIYHFGSSLLSRVNEQGNLIVGGEAISAIASDDEPHHLQLDDTHIGTVGSGLVTNLFIEALANGYGLVLNPFTDEEILEIAGIQTRELSAIATATD